MGRKIESKVEKKDENGTGRISLFIYVYSGFTGK